MIVRTMCSVSIAHYASKWHNNCKLVTEWSPYCNILARTESIVLQYYSCATRRYSSPLIYLYVQSLWQPHAVRTSCGCCAPTIARRGMFLLKGKIAVLGSTIQFLLYSNDPAVPLLPVNLAWT